MIKVGIIGIGKRGSQFLNTLSQLENIKLSFLCDTNPQKILNLKKEYPRIAIDEDFSCGAKFCDCVIIATPPSSHYEIAHYYLQRKIPVLLEKPSTLLPQQTNILFEISKKNKTHIQIGYSERYSPPFQYIKNHLPTNAITFIEAVRLNEFSKRVLEVDVILDLMIHDIDLILNLTKSVPVKFSVFTLPLCNNTSDFAKVFLQFNNIFAECTANRISSIKTREMTIYTSKQLFKLNFVDQSLTIASKKENDNTNKKDSIEDYINLTTIKNEFKNLILEEFNDFLKFIKDPLSYDHLCDTLTINTTYNIFEAMKNKQNLSF